MRIVDKEITGSDLGLLAQTFYAKLNPRRGDGKFHESYPAGKLQKLARISKNPRYLRAIKFLFDRVDKIFTGQPADLIKIHEDLAENINTHFGSSERLKDKKFKELINSVFNYNSFRGGARKLVFEWFEKLNLQTCPYCNRNWLTKIIKKESGKCQLLFDIDHYLPQSTYPYFALSFYNLIPSCTSCNQRIKRSGSLTLEKHLHPYMDDMDSIVFFDAQVDSLELFYKKTATVKLVLKRKKHVLNTEYERARKTYEFFRLEEIYQGHDDYVRELIQKNVVYSSSYLEFLFKTFGGANKLFESKADLMKMIMGNYVLPKETHKRPLAKLTKDLLESFDINSFLPEE